MADIGNQKQFVKGVTSVVEDKDACGVGFNAEPQQDASHRVLVESLDALAKMQERGGADAQGATGDGAGIETELPKELFKEFYDQEGGASLGDRDIAVGNFFLPIDPEPQEHIKEIIENTLTEMGFSNMKWRDVPTDDGVLGFKAAAVKPHLMQLMIPELEGSNQKEFEFALYLARRKIENKVRESDLSDEGQNAFYASSMSAKTLVYKGMTLATNIRDFYTDLTNEKYKTRWAKYHQRFSTNTSPVWSRAHPFRKLAHNGEINTLKGNKNNMAALQSLLKRAYGNDAADLLPVIQPGGSDSADIDNVMEALYFAGYPLESVKALLVPEAFENNDDLDPETKSLYRYLSTLSAPWDGPATLALSDGDKIIMGGDRSGFRPIRYAITKAGKIVAGSVEGTVKLNENEIVQLGNVAPGEIIGVDLKTGEFLDDKTLKASAFETFADFAEKWDSVVKIDPQTTPTDNLEFADSPDALKQRQRLFGFTQEIIDRDLKPMAEKGKEPLASMGHDAQEAYLAGEARHLPFSHFFKQSFAQVTNPPIDSARERMKMSLEVTCGSFEDIDGNDFNRKPIALKSPILSNKSFAAFIEETKNHSITIDTTFDCNAEEGEIERRIAEILDQAEEATRAGKHIILSDKEVSDNRAPIPVMLLTSVINARLNDEGIRHQTSINIQSAEIRDPHDFATLIGVGANTTNAYLAEETIMAQHGNGLLGSISNDEALQNYVKANEDSVLKIMSKMGVATVNSYRGAMLFGAKGLSQKFVDKYFPGIESPISGIGLETIEERIRKHHAAHVATDPEQDLRQGGLNQKRDGDAHPHASSSWANKYLRASAAIDDREESYKAHTVYTNHLQRQAEKNPVRVRDLMDFDTDHVKSIDIDDVEPVEEIMKRFLSGAISHGSISKEAHESLAIAMNAIGGMSNSGEGGESSARFGTDKNSKVKQVASGRFGVHGDYLDSATEEIQIKVAQGAKPGLGGELPGAKVSVEIAGLRGCAPGTPLISPPPHHDIYSIEDLSQLIFDLKEANPNVKVNVKLVAAPGVETIAVGVAKTGADVICISGGTGGTGASPQTAINHSGHEFEEYLARVHSALIENGLRENLKLTTDGGIRTGRDKVFAAAMGADSYGMGLGLLEAAGCQEARVCQNGTCPAGIATQMDELRRNFMLGKVKDVFADFGKHNEIVKDVMTALKIETQDDLFDALKDDQRKDEVMSEFAIRLGAKNIINHLTNNAQEMREYMAKLGCATADELIGRRDLLKQVKGEELGIDLEPALARGNIEAEHGVHYKKQPRKEYQDPIRPNHISWDRDLVAERKENIVSGDFTFEETVNCEDRNIGTRISHELRQEFEGAANVPDKAVTLKLKGVAGQSFGAFTSQGVSLELEGRANDYVGKGMGKGADITVKPVAGTAIEENSQDNTIIGNTCLYGATGGQVNAAGKAGNRFAVRNSGASAVIEGAQDDACEYMCAGEVVILGSVGRNFGAGMSGGEAFVFDADNSLEKTANSDVKSYIRSVSDDAEASAKLRDRVEKHVTKTGSKHAQRLLDNWDNAITNFKYIAPAANNNMSAPAAQPKATA